MVSAATDTAVSASISTPVRATASTVTVMSTVSPFASSTTSTASMGTNCVLRILPPASSNPLLKPSWSWRPAVSS